MFRVVIIIVAGIVGCACSFLISAIWSIRKNQNNKKVEDTTWAEVVFGKGHRGREGSEREARGKRNEIEREVSR